MTHDHNLLITQLVASVTESEVYCCPSSVARLLSCAGSIVSQFHFFGNYLFCNGNINGGCKLSSFFKF